MKDYSVLLLAPGETTTYFAHVRANNPENAAKNAVRQHREMLRDEVGTPIRHQASPSEYRIELVLEGHLYNKPVIWPLKRRDP